MTVKLYYKPKVRLISKPQFIAPLDIDVNWIGDSTDAERLVEFGGRLCYTSFHNPAKRTTNEYLNNIKADGHGSVFEHANFSILFEQVSRSLTHELVRHRSGMAYSQVSQRFVSMDSVGFVVPPMRIGDCELERDFWVSMERALGAYEVAALRIAEKLRADPEYANEPTLRRKRAREAARADLPNATETKILCTGNARAWRHILTMRGAKGADLEIQRLAVATLDVLRPVAPSLFDDLTVDDGVIHTKFPKI